MHDDNAPKTPGFGSATIVQPRPFRTDRGGNDTDNAIGRKPLFAKDPLMVVNAPGISPCHGSMTAFNTLFA